MPEQPPPQLVALLERLGLASGAQVARMGRQVGRLARDLPRFESVWVDALKQARILTPLQAAEINAGRAETLRLGPYLLGERLAHPHYTACYRASNVENREVVRLAVVENADGGGNRILEQLESLAAALCSPGAKGAGRDNAGSAKRIGACGERSAGPHSSTLPKGEGTLASRITRVGTDGSRIFVAGPWVEGRTAADWIVHHGRLSPEVVLEVARAMLAELVELERVGVCHGDVSLSSLVLGNAGEATLVLPGVRPVLRPEEGYAHADLTPEAYDSLAPERVSNGTPANSRSDIYACGCVWWHLLCGRPPLVGGSSVAKLRAAQAGEICDVRRYAPDVPPQLAAAISACLEREPGRRPESMVRLAAMLGSPTRAGKEALADCLARGGRPTVQWTTTVRAIRKSNRTPLWLAGTVCCLAACVALLWPVWHGRLVGGTVAVVEPSAQLAKSAKRPTRKDASETQAALTLALSQRERGPEAAEGGLEADAVVPAAYQQVEAKPKDIELPAGEWIEASSLRLHANQCVRGAAGGRGGIFVPYTGLVVDKENVRFENVDFLWQSPQPTGNARAAESAIVQLLAGRADFRGCSFRCEATGGGQMGAPAAIRWVHPATAERSDTAMPNGQLRIADCLMHRVSVGVECRTIGALAIDVKNTLHVEAGPFVLLDHCPQSDEPISVALAQVTLRNATSLLECLAPRMERQPGEMMVTATACAFVPEADMPLIRLTAGEMPERLLPAIRWMGQGSLVALSAPIVAWGMPDGEQQEMDESSVSIAGLVRSDVRFAGPASGDPAASQLTRWQAPLQSADRPGIDAEALPKLRRGGAKE